MVPENPKVPRQQQSCWQEGPRAFLGTSACPHLKTCGFFGGICRKAGQQLPLLLYVHPLVNASFLPKAISWWPQQRVPWEIVSAHCLVLETEMGVGNASSSDPVSSSHPGSVELDGRHCTPPSPGWREERQEGDFLGFKRCQRCPVDSGPAGVSPSCGHTGFKEGCGGRALPTLYPSVGADWSRCVQKLRLDS